jgi:bifunctional non-homologous end joining protein LigD
LGIDIAAATAVLSHRDLALLTARSRPFSSPEWLYELKWDGYRVLALRGDAVRLLSRQGRDMTAAFPEVVGAVATLPQGTALDGELVILDAEGRPLFDYLARAWRTTSKAIREASVTRPATLIAFDIMFDAGVDVRSEAIEQRKKRLVERVPSGPHIRPLLPVEGEGEWLYQQAEALRLEGVVAKRKGSLYRAGRTADWLKIKTPHGVEVERERFAYRS